MGFKLNISIIVCVLLATAFLILNLESTKVVTTMDEFAYKKYIHQISSYGIEGYRDIVSWYNESPKNRMHPSPTRLGFLLPLAVCDTWFPVDVYHIAVMSAVAHLVFLIISFYFSRKFYGQDFALGVVLLLSASPLMLGMASSGLTESLCNLLWACSVWLFLDFTKTGKRSSFGLMIFALSWALLVREMTIILIGLLVLATICFRIFFKGKIAINDVIAMIVIPACVALVAYFLMLGCDFNYLYKLIHSIYQTHFQDESNLYAINFSSGPWFRYIIDFMLLAPAVTLFAIGYVFKLFKDRLSLDWDRFFWLFYLIGALVAFNMLPHSKVVRFAINLDMVLCLFAVWMVLEIFKMDVIERVYFKPFITLVIIFTLSLSGFYYIFVAKGRLIDPITRDLLIPQGFMPPVKGSTFYERAIQNKGLFAPLK